MNGLKVILGLLACVLFASAFEKEANGDNYIVGGRAANRNQFPWMASVRTMQNQHFCGGFILSDRWVGSAAHCTQGNLANPHNVLIATGAHTRYDGNRHRVNRIMLHPRFNRQYLTNDVCIIQTADRIPITLRGPIRAIRFPDGPNIHNGSVAFIAGWGITEHPRAPGQGIPQVLQWKPTMIITRQECQERYGVQRTQLIHADTVCTSNPDGKGACSKDTGGPLVDQQGICIGIASWGMACARGYPDVYTTLWSTIPFLRQVSQNSIPNLPRPTKPSII